jgi:hypothetical protein
MMLLAGCGAGSGAPATPDGAPLTLAQASLLAEVLHRNTEAGGAVFVLTALDPATGATVVLDGAVDWVNGAGRASATGLRDAGGEVAAVAWTRDAVAELRPGRAGPAEAYWLRTIDPALHSVDRFIGVVAGLAATRPENAQLVLQKPDAAFLRDDVLRDVDVTVLRYSERTVLWIDPVSGSLLRFEGNDRTGGAPVVVDLIELGPVRIELPTVVTG